MWPDDPVPARRGRPLPGDVVVPFEGARLDHDLAILDTELQRAAGRAARARARGGRERPAPAFAEALRDRLLREVASPAASVLTPAFQSGVVPARGSAGAHQPAALQPRLTRRTPTVLPAPRWSLLAVAAVFIASFVVIGTSRLFPAPATARVVDAVGASLWRDGSSSPLAAGIEIRAGDTVSVADGGRAALQLGGSTVRLDGGAAMRVDRLRSGITLDQLRGRAWHRVNVATGDTYAVTTGDLRWTAAGTAFDLERTAKTGGERIRLVAVQHDINLAGPALALRVPEGHVAVVERGGTADVTVSGVSAADLADPWLLANAGLDQAAGFATGALTAALLDASPTPTNPGSETGLPTASPGDGGASPTAEPSASATSPSPTATAKPTPTPTPKPTPKPTPRPTPTPPPFATLSLAAFACAGTALLDWSGSPGDAFNHYLVLRAPGPFDVPDAYPPPAPVVGLEGSYTTDPARSWYADGTLGADGSRWYRAVAWDAEDRAIGASAAVELGGGAVADLGPFAAEPAAGGVNAAWTPFGGPSDCFTYYKVSWSATNPNPSYLGDNDGAQAVGGQDAGAAFVALEPGTWYVRVEAILGWNGTKLVVGRSDIVQVTVSP